jgi:Chaperone of endosialidase
MKKLFIIVFIVTTKICIAQNVGVGLTNPQTKLDILSNGNNWFDGGMSFSDNNSNRYFLYKDLSNSFHIGLNGVKNLTISNGNVGIGLTNPQTKLDVLSNGNNWFDGGMSFSDNNSNRYFLYKDLSNSFHIGFNGVKNLTILNGNVGIGINAPNAPLTFANTLTHKITLFQGSIGPIGIGAYPGELRLQNDIPSGKISLGTLDAGGNYSENALAQRSGVYAFSVLGSLWVNGTTYSSDERFKQNITTISSPLQKLLQINGVEYEMKTSEFPKNHFQLGRQIGLLAQNVEKIIPEAVGEKDGYKGVDYARLVPLLIESIKEQQKQIELQQKQIDELKLLVQKLLNK